MKFKRSQEEMIGFALIIILVSVILLAFLGFSLSKPPKDLVNNHEVENFIQAFLQYTTDCEDSDYLSVQDLIFECYDGSSCSDERDSCEALNNTMKDILIETWPVGEDRPTKAYELIINSEGGDVDIKIREGNFTGYYKGASQIFSRKRTDFNIMFRAYF